MGAFKIEIVGVGGHGCERKAKAGEKLHGRCGRFNCPDCIAYEFTQQLRQKGMVRDGDIAIGNELAAGELVPEGAEEYFTDMDYRLLTIEQAATQTPVRRFYRFFQKAEFTHWPHSPSAVVDDMLKNERKAGQF